MPTTSPSELARSLLRISELAFGRTDEGLSGRLAELNRSGSAADAVWVLTLEANRLIGVRQGSSTQSLDLPLETGLVRALRRWLDDGSDHDAPEALRRALGETAGNGGPEEGALRLTALCSAELGGPHVLAFDGGDRDVQNWLAVASASAVYNSHHVGQLREEATTDELTGASNYRHLMATLRHWTDGGRRFALLMVDVDNLKEYNAQYGHLAGSAALCEIAALFRGHVRPQDLVAKYGGDEFCVLLPDTEIAEAQTAARELMQEVREHRFEGDRARRLTVSVGLALSPEDGQSPRELLRSADGRLFRAKEEGRDRTVAPDPTPTS